MNARLATVGFLVAASLLLFLFWMVGAMALCVGLPLFPAWAMYLTPVVISVSLLCARSMLVEFP